MSNIQEIDAIQQIDVGDVNQVKKLGEGSIGAVYKLQKTNPPIAFKCFKDVNLIKELATLEQEAFNHLGQNSNTVIKYYCTKEMFIMKNDQKYEAKIMFMKYYDLNLRKQMLNGISQNVFKQLFSNLIYSLSYLKFKEIFCSSLKPETIFLEKSVDDGTLNCLLSRVCRKQQNSENNFQILKSKYGYFYQKLFLFQAHFEISYYTAPELFKQNENSQKNDFDPFSSDIYSLGVIFFEILYGTKATEQLHQAKIIFT